MSLSLCWWMVIVMTNEVYSPFLISFRNWIQSSPACHEPFLKDMEDNLLYVTFKEVSRRLRKLCLGQIIFMNIGTAYSLLSSEIFLDACEMLTKLSNEPKMSVSLQLGVWIQFDICKIHKRGFFLLGVMKCEWFTRLTWFDLV